MKIFDKIFIYLLLLFTYSFAQIDTTSLSYYPLNNGDYWEYEEMRVQTPPLYPCTTFYYYSVEVVGDTTLSNFKKYKVLEISRLGSIFYRFERVDTLSCNVYRYIDWIPGNDYMIDSLKSIVGDTSRACRIGYCPITNAGSICFDICSDTILSVITSTKKIKQLLSYEIHHLSAGLGISFYFGVGLYVDITETLKYAVINGVEYGFPVITGVNKFKNQVKSFRLSQNYPNPFNSTTTISFELSQNSFVEITIYDVTGKKIKNLKSNEYGRGVHNIRWNGTNQSGQQVSSGIYIYSLKATIKNKSNIKSNKMILLQ